MGLILDTSVLIAEERGKFDLLGLLSLFPAQQPVIAAITASELLHGVERAQDAARKARRQRHVEQILMTFFIQPFDLAQARCHAQIWADLEARGLTIGAHDLQIAAAALGAGHELATLNVKEFQRIPGLRIVNTAPFSHP